RLSHLRLARADARPAERPRHDGRRRDRPAADSRLGRGSGLRRPAGGGDLLRPLVAARSRRGAAHLRRARGALLVKLGFFTMPLHPVGRDWRQTLAEDREAVLLAEKLGFEEAFIGEHVTDLAETITNCLIFIATLARDTKRIRLGSGTVNLANRHPAITAAEIAMVDTLLEGRFILGVGPGGLPSDAEMMETMDLDRNAIFVEAMDHMIGLWTREPPYRLEGKRWRLSTERTWTPDLGMGALLKPFQKPHPPIVVTAILPASNGIAAAAERGWTPISANFVHPWVIKTHWPKYAEGCARSGREAKREDWRVAKSIFVADDDATVRRMTRDPGNPFAYYFRNLQRKAEKKIGR